MTTRISALRLGLRQLLSGEGASAHVTSAVIFLATLASATLLALGTMAPFAEEHPLFLARAEIGLSSFFLLEYLARLWSAEKPLAYVLSFWGIVDFAASLPVLLVVGGNTASVRTLRLLRLARLTKLLRIGGAEERIIRAFRSIAPELGVFFVFAAVLIFFAATGIYFFESEAQPGAFGSIPQSLWWAVITLTTVGYGDVYPVTPGGRVFTGLLLLIAISIVAIPTGLISAALTATRHRDDSCD